jgi:hypothetical protein
LVAYHYALAIGDTTIDESRPESALQNYVLDVFRDGSRRIRRGPEDLHAAAPAVLV